MATNSLHTFARISHVAKSRRFGRCFMYAFSIYCATRTMEYPDSILLCYLYLDTAASTGGSLPDADSSTMGIGRHSRYCRPQFEYCRPVGSVSVSRLVDRLYIATRLSVWAGRE